MAVKRGYSFHVGDLFHVGHLHQLIESRKHCDYLIVGILTDEAVKSYKRTPIIPYDQRARVYEALGVVDEVIPQDGRDPTENLKRIKPDVLFHGDDWHHLPGADWMESQGLQVVRTPYCLETSTSEIIETVLATQKLWKQRRNELIVLGAAGWKGSGMNIDVPPGPAICQPLGGCPEPLLPIGGGETSLSRLVRQFKAVGFSNFAIGVGEPGCNWPPPSHYHGGVLGDGYSPWTEERVAYAAQFGEVVIMPNPYEHTHWHTAATVLEQCGADYDNALILLADFVLTDQFVEFIAAVPRPCELLEKKLGSSMFWLNKAGSEAFIQAAWRDWGDHLRNDGLFRVSKKATMVQALRKAGVPLITIDKVLACRGYQWRDIDTADSYSRILEWLGA